MSIFGKMDAANIPTNPYFIEAGEYHSEVTKAFFKDGRNKDGDATRQLVLEFTIKDEDSQYNGRKQPAYYNLVDPNMTQEDYELLPAKEKASIQRELSKLKRDLCGNENNSSQKGLGVDIEDLNDDSWKPETLIGTEVTLALSNWGPTNEGVNIKWVNLAE
jgi:hypothetical protein